jgi:Ca2+-binding RTX toxin-like protein
MTPTSTRLALTAALAAIGALAIPATAGATVTSVVNDSTLTVTGDDAVDTIALAAAGGVITVNGGPTTLPANDNSEFVVVAGGACDTVDASALAATSYGLMTINGGDGDDLLTGGADNDELDGDAGEDRLIGFRGGDRVFGDAGNDTMVWNNGDGTDTNDGEAGNDEVEVNGAPTAGDAFTAKPGVEPGHVQFNRTNLVQFAIDLAAERLTVNGLGGGDAFAPDPATPAGLAGRTALTLDGGSGIDTLTGGDGADLIAGGDNTDVLDGGAGDDRVVGDRGTDTHLGGDGDDVLVWNNGDGSDDVNGQAGFDRAEVNGSAGGADAFTLAPEGQGARFERTNLVPFAITLSAQTEGVEVNGAAGNDALQVAAGLGQLAVVADGGGGDDELAGSGEEDDFLGGSGDDILDPGAGSDLVAGGLDDDQIAARDGNRDLVRGGAGTDAAQTDSITEDIVTGIENLDALPDEPRALLPELGEFEVIRSGGRLVARAPVTCPEAEDGGCHTTLTMETAKPVRVDGVRAVVVLGTRTLDIDPGDQATARIRLAKGAEALADGRTLATRVRITSENATGGVARDTVRVDLRIPRH